LNKLFFKDDFGVYMKILVTGGAGYIGSHVVKHLISEGKYDITVLDNLDTGFLEPINILREIDSELKFVNSDLSDWKEVRDFMNKEKFDAVLHFAASLIVSESILFPEKYYKNNTANTTNLVNCCVESGVKYFVFSSTAAVYGEPDDIPAFGVGEDFPVAPINPYGKSKLFSEEVIMDTAKAHPDFKYVILRYFNVAGADTSGLIGQDTQDATHLIKTAVETSLGKRDEMYIFGDDYNTPDGTCIRDYIHVDDLATAHVLSLDYLKNNMSDTFNCGYGYGFSVKEVIDVVRKVSGEDFKAVPVQRREGDPAELVSDSRKIKKMMGWEPKFNDLEYICSTALEWDKKKTEGIA
jgi:UDP-glucose 4-epimerase